MQLASINSVILQGCITNILEENVVQPLLVSTSAITLATETVRSILKIDDIVSGSLYGYTRVACTDGNKFVQQYQYFCLAILKKHIGRVRRVWELLNIFVWML